MPNAASEVYRKYLNALKWRLRPLVESNIYVQSLGFTLMRNFPGLLPHDSDYCGFKHFLDPSGERIFLDLGANMGLSALSFRAIDKIMPIFSIEPNPGHRASLERIGESDRTFHFRIAAAGAKPGSFRLLVPYVGRLALHTMASSSPEMLQRSIDLNIAKSVVPKIVVKGIDVEVLPVDDLGLKPAIIKLDVEGSEAEAIRGALKTIRKYRPCLLVEFNPTNYRDCLDLLTPLGYEPFYYDSHRDVFSQKPDENFAKRNVFFIAKEKIAGLPRNDLPYDQ